MRRLSGTVFLGILFLVMSTSKVLVVAQQSALKDADAASKNVTNEQVAKLLSGVFGGLASSFTTLGGLNATTGTTTATSTPTSAGTAANPKSTLPPNLASLLRAINGTGNNATVVRVANAIEAALKQQQQAGDLSPLESAAKTVQQFIQLPTSIGTGENINKFVERVSQFKSLYDSVAGFLDPAAAATILQNLIGAEQLALGAVGLPLAALAFFTALLALGAGITGLIAGIFYCVGSALALAASVIPLGGAPGFGAPAVRDGTDPITSQDWYKSVVTSSSSLVGKFLPFVFDTNSPVSLLRIADTTLGAVDQASTYTTDLANGNFTQIQFSLPGFPSSLADTLANTFTTSA